MVFIWFLLAAVITVFTAMKLSVYADVISNKTAMGGMVVGTILLAGATSLPEVTTSFSAVMIDNVDIAVGNMLGSNVFNVFILALFDLYYRKNRLFQLASKHHKYTANLGLLLMVLVTVALITHITYNIWAIGLDALLIMVLYVVGMAVISRLPSPSASQEEAKQKPDGKKSISIKHAVTGFVIAAILILGAGTLLSITGDQIATITGMGSSFIGSFLIAATTSLPEGVSVFSALRLKNVNLAIGAILGSNMLNMLILAASDAVYRKGTILTDASPSHLVSAIGGSLLVIVIIWSFMRKPPVSLWAYSVPSIITVIGYFIVQYLIFQS